MSLPGIDDVIDDNQPLYSWEILREVVMALVGRPEQVRITEQETGDTSSHFTIYVADEDVGKVIGKNGETIITLRKLFARIAANQGRKAFIQVVEPNNNPRTATSNRRRVAA